MNAKAFPLNFIFAFDSDGLNDLAVRSVAPYQFGSNATVDLRQQSATKAAGLDDDASVDGHDFTNRRSAPEHRAR